MNHLPSFICQGYEIDSLDFNMLANFPGFIYLKSTNSHYLWTNLNLSRVAVGIESVDAIKDSTDFDFHWKLCADQMRENDQQVIKTKNPIHTFEISQKYNGMVQRLVTYKIPLYKNTSLIGLMGISCEQPVNNNQSLLTSREKMCITLATQGLSDKEIADKLNISRRTVEAYFQSSKAKLKVKSRNQLIGTILC
jgi:DNA-binding CsgD family transcriptional regulator